MMLNSLTTSEVIFNLLLWVILIFVYRKQFKTRNIGPNNYNFLLIIVVLYSTFGYVSGDYFHYEELYDRITRTTNITAIHLESFYLSLIEFLPEDYNLWRFAVWGLSTIVTILIFKKLNLNPQFTTLIFTLVLMQYFAAPRNTLGYMVLYFGVAWLLYSKPKSLVSMVVGIVIICCSTLFHKSMILYIFLIIISLIPIKKIHIITALFLFPILYVSIIKYSMLLLPYLTSDTDSAEAGMRYLESDNAFVSNFNGMIKLGIWRIPLLILLVKAIIDIYFKKVEVPNFYKVILNYTMILVYISLLLYGQKTSAFLTTRFWDASTYTATIFIAYYYYNRPSKILTKCLYALLIANIYDFALTIYKL